MSSRRTEKMTEWIQDAQRVFAPLSAFGFDTIFEDAAAMIHNVTGYPPYNVIRTEGETVIEVALAGLSSDDLKVFVENNVLHVKYDKTVEKIKEDTVGTKEFVHQGIASRSFDLSLPIAQGVVVSCASIKNGLLQLHLSKVLPPEPQRNFIDITTGM